MSADILPACIRNGAISEIIRCTRIWPGMIVVGEGKVDPWLWIGRVKLDMLGDCSNEVVAEICITLGSKIGEGRRRGEGTASF